MFPDHPVLPQVVCLDIQDNYHFLDPELVPLLQERTQAALRARCELSSQRADQRLRRSRSAFAITDSELSVIAALAQIGLTSTPSERIEHAGGDRHADRVVGEGEEQVLPDVAHRARLRRRARTSARRSPLTSVMPALSIATSVPVPIAMPTAACGERRRVVDAVAGHRHDRAARLQLADDVALLRRQHLGANVVGREAELRRRPPSPVSRASPVSMTMRSPSARSASSASRAPALIGSATAMHAREPSVDRDVEDRARLRRCSRRTLRRPRRTRSTPCVAHHRGVAERPRRTPPTRAAHALSRSSTRSVASAATSGRAPSRRATIADGERMLAALLQRGGEAQQILFGACRTSRSRRPRAVLRSACRSCR